MWSVTSICPVGVIVQKERDKSIKRLKEKTYNKINILNCNSCCYAEDVLNKNPGLESTLIWL